MSALDNVLSLPELLEAILLRVDNKTLLLMQRVSKHFQANISSSIQLQEKLFFRQPRAIAGDGYSLGDMINPLLPWREAAKNWGRVKVAQNQDAEKDFRFYMRLGAVQEIPRHPDAVAIWYIRLNVRVAKQWTGKESWRRMYLFPSGHFPASVSVRWQDVWMGYFSKVSEHNSQSRDEANQGFQKATFGEVFDERWNLRGRKDISASPRAGEAGC